MKTILSDRLYYFILIAFALFSFVLIYISMHWGVGLTPDSMVYIRIAESYTSDDGVLSSQHFPPLYSFILYLSSVGTGDIVVSAGWVQISVFLISVLSLGMIIKRHAEQNALWLLMGVITLFTAPQLFSIYLMAWSEGLFLLLSLAGFYFLASFIAEQSRVALFWCSAFFALAVLTRYAGVVLIGTGILGLLFFLRVEWKERIRDSLLLTFLSLFPLISWLLWGKFTHAEVSPRAFSIHLISVEKLYSGLTEILSWFYLSSPLSWGLFAVFLSTFFLLRLRCQYRLIKPPTLITVLSKLLFLFVPLYLSFLVISISFFDAHTPLDTRILIPVYFFIIIAVVINFSETILEKRLCKILTVAAFTILLVLNFVQISLIKQYVTYYSTNGMGFLSRKWALSDTLAFAKKEIGENRLIYTNAPEIIEVHLRRESKFLPKKVNALSEKENAGFNKSLALLEQEFAQKNGVLIYFYAFSARTYLPGLEELRDNIDLELMYQGRDGVVLQARQ